MKLGQFTGVSTTGEMVITKPVSTICVAFSDAVTSLSNELITVQVERENGNAIVLNRVSVKSLLLLQTYSSNIIQLGDFVTNAILPLTPDGGAVALGQNERIKVTVEGLQSAKIYKFYAEEEPFTTHRIFDYDKKALLVGEDQRLLDFQGYDQIVIQGADSINDMRIIYDNGATCLHTLYEVKLNSYTADAVAFIQDKGVVTEIPNVLVMPLLGVKAIDFSKIKNDLVEIVCRKQRNLVFTNTPVFQNPRPAVRNQATRV